jgi:integrase
MTAFKPRNLPKLRRGEGSIWWDEKRRQVVFEHRVRGKVFRERGDTVADVFELRDARQDEVAEATERASRLADGGATTVGDLMALWLGYDVSGAPQTLVGYRNSAAHITRLLGARRVCELTVVDVEACYATLVGEGLGAWSLRQIRSHLTMAVAFAVRRGYAEGNVVRESRLPKTTPPPGDPAWLTREQFGELRRHLVANQSPANTALLFMLLTGARPGEALGLRWSAVNLDARTARVETALQNQGTGRHQIVEQLKTRASRRTVELAADLVVALRALRRTSPVTGLVFATTTGMPLDPANVRRSCRKACVAVGADEMSSKALRHSLLSTLIDGGVPLPAAARHAGHVNTRMVSEVYGHGLDEVVPVAALLDRLTS